MNEIYSAVAKAYQRLSVRLTKGKALRRGVENIRDNLSKIKG